MRQSKGELSVFQAYAEDNRQMSWFGILDKGQNTVFSDAQILSNNRAECLFGAAKETMIARYSPHLIELPSPNKGCAIWSWIGKNAKLNSNLTILTSSVPFEEILSNLSSCLDVALPDGEEMYLAFWDPAILGSLMGQHDDLSLHVNGPVFNAEQRARLCRSISSWWYWDRFGEIHSISIEQPRNLLNKFQLNQSQVDMLVECSIPDQILFHLQKNLPLLLRDESPVSRYRKVQGALVKARELRLTTMNELVNFVCLSLSYETQLECDVEIANLLSDVKIGKFSLYEAMHNFPS